MKKMLAVVMMLAFWLTVRQGFSGPVVGVYGPFQDYWECSRVGGSFGYQYSYSCTGT